MALLLSPSCPTMEAQKERLKVWHINFFNSFIYKKGAFVVMLGCKFGIHIPWAHVPHGKGHLKFMLEGILCCNLTEKIGFHIFV